MVEQREKEIADLDLDASMGIRRPADSVRPAMDEKERLSGLQTIF